MSISFELAEGRGLESIGAMWRDLEVRADAPIFLSWDWIGCWLAESEAAGAPPAAMLIGRQGEAVVLLGALIPRRRREPPVVADGLRLHTLGHDDQDVITIEYNGFLVARGQEGAAETAALAFLLAGPVVAGRRRDELHLKGVPDRLAPLVPPGPHLTSIVSRKPSWRADLAGTRALGRSYLDGLSANTRQQVRRAMRLYAERGPLLLTRATDVPEAMAFLEGLRILHQRYWNQRDEPGAFAYPFFEAFHRRLIRTAFPDGVIELARISAGETAIGYLYNFVHRGHVYSYQSGFLYEEDARLKPGLVSHALCAERHLAEGQGCYDFMAGEARYKASLGVPGPEMLYVLLQRRTTMLTFDKRLHAAKEWLLRHLPRTRG